MADLSQPLPAYQSHFDLIASHLVLNDVYDYQGFLTTLGAVAKPGGHLVLSLNNPYSYVVRGHITNYFESGKAFPIEAWQKQESRSTFINEHWRSIWMPA